MFCRLSVGFWIVGAVEEVEVVLLVLVLMLLLLLVGGQSMNRSEPVV